MPGICLRQDALRRSVELSAPRSVSLDDEGLAGAFVRLSNVLDKWPERQPRREATPTPPDRPARRDRRQGGTPL